MTIRELIERASKGYEVEFPELPLLVHCKPDGTPTDNPTNSLGDSLGLFIVTELNDTYDADATDADQLEAARNSITAAIEDLHNVLDAL